MRGDFFLSSRVSCFVFFQGETQKNKRKRSYGQIIFISFTVEYAVKCSRMSVFVG